MLYWAAPTMLNPHLAVAPKDFESSQLFYEPLADIDTDHSQALAAHPDLHHLDRVRTEHLIAHGRKAPSTVRTPDP